MARRCELIALVLLAACKREQKQPAPQPQPQPEQQVASDLIPRTTGPIELDGEWKEPDWSQHALRHQFLGDDGQLARPSSEVRLLHDKDDLIVGLYAADENIQSESDAFDFSIASVAVRVTAAGKITPEMLNVRARVDHDGTLDNPKDDDEEWVIELAIPLTTIAIPPGSKVPVRAARCDVTKDGVKRCGAWSGSVGLAP